jgi:hypothetical protein
VFRQYIQKPVTLNYSGCSRREKCAFQSHVTSMMTVEACTIPGHFFSTFEKLLNFLPALVNSR